MACTPFPASSDAALRWETWLFAGVVGVSGHAGMLRVAAWVRWHWRGALCAHLRAPSTRARACGDAHQQSLMGMSAGLSSRAGRGPGSFGNGVQGRIPYVWRPRGAP
eukprot:2090355-Prymnesium_polylepis.1